MNAVVARHIVGNPRINAELVRPLDQIGEDVGEAEGAQVLEEALNIRIVIAGAKLQSVPVQDPYSENRVR